MPNNSTYSADLDRATIAAESTDRAAASCAPLPIRAGIERPTSASIAPVMPIRFSTVWGSSPVRGFSPVNSTLV
jgi:hypothetical protein